MAASNTPIPDLIELNAISQLQSYYTSPASGGGIIGYVDNATYSDGDFSNSATQVAELNDTFSANGGTLHIDGVNYNIQLIVPDGFGNDVTVTYDNGASTMDLGGNGGSTEIVFIIASPVGGGSDRYFAAIDDDMGNFPDITTIQTRGLDFNPAGDDVMIDLDQNNLVTVCFAAGTMLETDQGPRRAEEITTGDLLRTADHGLRAVRWTHAQRIRFDGSAQSEKQRPVRIARSALGPGMPTRDLTVSPQHRILLASPIVDRVLGVPEILAPAVHLISAPGICRDKDCAEVTYVHLFLGTHEVIFAEGALTESFLPATEALRALPAPALQDVQALAFDPVPPARPIIERAPVLRKLVARHVRNFRPLCTPNAYRRARAQATAAAPRFQVVR